MADVSDLRGDAARAEEVCESLFREGEGEAASGEAETVLDKGRGVGGGTMPMLLIAFKLKFKFKPKLESMPEQALEPMCMMSMVGVEGGEEEQTSELEGSSADAEATLRSLTLGRDKEGASLFVELVSVAAVDVFVSMAAAAADSLSFFVIFLVLDLGLPALLVLARALAALGFLSFFVFAFFVFAFLSFFVFLSFLSFLPSFSFFFLLPLLSWGCSSGGTYMSSSAEAPSMSLIWML